jgi:hypothetical protein
MRTGKDGVAINVLHSFAIEDFFDILIHILVMCCVTKVYGPAQSVRNHATADAAISQQLMSKARNRPAREG